jgi:protein gp37
VSYTSDCAFWPAEIFEELLLDALNMKWITFTFLTKFPDLLLDKLTSATRNLRENGTNLSNMDNVIFATSVGLRSKKYRLDQLRKFESLGLGAHLQPWFKPVLEDLGRLDLSGFKSLRMQVEKGANKRPFEKRWLLSIIKQATEQGVVVCCDIRYSDHFKKRISLDLVKDLNKRTAENHIKVKRIIGFQYNLYFTKLRIKAQKERRQNEILRQSRNKNKKSKVRRCS